MISKDSTRSCGVLLQKYLFYFHAFYFFYVKDSITKVTFAFQTQIGQIMHIDSEKMLEFLQNKSWVKIKNKKNSWKE
jgi:hypothetical protein